MKDQRNEISTADVARATDDVRARSNEQMRGRDPMAERPADARPAQMPPDVERHIPGGQAQSVEERDRGSMKHETEMLFPGNEADALRSRWMEIQGTFVDEPRRAVESADCLVAEVMKRMAEVFASERAALEKQWDRGDKVTTEDLRIALQRYRAFFDRLLSV